MSSRRSKAGYLSEYTLDDKYLLKPDHRPRIHAKVLGWDGDYLAMSSLNWLSANSSEAMPFREIEVLVNAPGIADNSCADLNRR